MRREFIYPHRSVRSFPLSRSRLLATLAIALVSSVSVFSLGTPLLDAHGSLAEFILALTRIPVTGTPRVSVFAHLGSVAVPEIPIPSPRGHPLRIGIAFAVSLAGLVLVHRRFPLGRNFVIFLMILLCAAGAVVLINPSTDIGSRTFGQIWLRGEILVWILLPWASAFLFMLTLPSFWVGVAWSILLQVYIALWSAVRLAFCLGVLHFLGVLFMPILWFSFGVLFDLAIVLLFYSFALDRSIRQVAGLRKS